MIGNHSPTLAVIFSVLLPGLGQFYNQEIIKAGSFFFGRILLSFVYCPLGLFVLVIASIDAFLRAKRLRETGFISQNHKTAIFILIALVLVGFFAGFFGGSIVNLLK